MAKGRPRKRPVAPEPPRSTRPAASGSPSGFDTHTLFQQPIKGIRIPIRGLPGGGIRLPPLNLAQLTLVGAGAVLGGLAVYSAASPHSSGPSSKTTSTPAKRKWLPRIFSSGALATDALSYGSPGNIHDLLLREAYVAAYDRSKRHPAWTAEHLTKANLKRQEPPASPSSSPSAPAPTAQPIASTSTLPALSPPSPSTATPGAATDPAGAATLVPVGKVTPPAQGAVDRLKSEFHEDRDIPELFRAKLVDYVGSGYDRGHMVAAADAKRSQSAMNETFALSNIAPQVGEGFNRHYWAWLESFCRNLTKSFEDVYVFTVPLYLPKLDERTKKWRISYEVIGPPGLAPSVSVPTHFAKVVLARRAEGAAALGAFVLPNAKIPDLTPLESFKVPVDSVERAAGVVFFSDDAKAASQPLCEMTKCEVVRRFFDDSGNISVLEPAATPTEAGAKPTPLAAAKRERAQTV